MSKLDTLIQDLVIANRILAREDVVDAYGHISVRHPDNPKRFFISRKMPSRCIFFLSAFRAWSTLLSRTRTCTLAPSLMFRRVKAKAPQNGGFESRGSSRKGLKSPFARCRRTLSRCHFLLWEQGLARASACHRKSMRHRSITSLSAVIAGQKARSAVFALTTPLSLPGLTRQSMRHRK